MYTRNSHTFLIRVCIHLKYDRYLRGFILKRLLGCTSITYYIINTAVYTYVTYYCIGKMLTQISEALILLIYILKMSLKYVQVHEIVPNWFSLLILIVLYSHII